MLSICFRIFINILLAQPWMIDMLNKSIEDNNWFL